LFGLDYSIYLYSILPRRVLRLSRKLVNCRDGAIAIEFAMIAPILIIMAISVYDVSLAIKQKLALQNATRIGVQYGLVRRPVQGDMQHVINAVEQTLPPKWDKSNAATQPQISAALRCECSTGLVIACGSKCSAGQTKLTYLKVEITKTYQTMLPYPGFDSNFEISDESIVRLQ